MQKNEVKAIRKKTFKSLGIILLIVLIVFLFFAIRETNKAGEEETLPLTYSFTSEDSSLIATKYRNRIDVVEVNNSKLRNSIATLRFDNSFNIIIYKINTEKEFSMQRILHIENTRTHISNGYVYTLIGRDIIYNLWYKNGITKPIQTIFLSYSGDSLQTGVMNDSIVSYHLLGKNVSVKYSQDEPVDLFILIPIRFAH